MEMTRLTGYSTTTNLTGTVAGIGGGYLIGKKVYEIRKRNSRKTGLGVPIVCGILGGMVVSAVTAQILQATGI